MKRFVLLVIFLLSLSMVSAEFNQENAKSWLNSNIAWGSASLEEVSFATIVLGSSRGLNQLNSKKDSQTGCFPKNGCTTKDTALATLALNSRGQLIEEQLEYLESNLKSSNDFNINEWNIQVVVNEAGSCVIKYEEGEEGVTFNFGEEGNLEGESTSWINFDSLPNFNFDKPVEELNIECEFDTTTPRISIIKRIVNSFYIIEERFSDTVNFEIENGCYSATPNSGCDRDASFYASWVLKKLGVDITTENYLRDVVGTDLEYAMLGKIDDSQLPLLIGKQKQDDSFDSSVYVTSFAIDSLKNSNYLDELNKAKIWVEEQQTEEGIIGGGVKDTSIALYLIYNEGVTGDTDDEGGSGGGFDIPCDTDFDCNLEGGEVCNTITKRCEVPALVGCSRDSDCEIGEICDIYTDTCYIPSSGEEQPVCGDFKCESGENDPLSSFYCFSDCQEAPSGGSDSQVRCGDGVCERLEGENEDSCPADCETKSESGSLWWLWLIIIILVLGGGAFFVLMKMKKGGKRESPSYLQRPRTPPMSSPQQRYNLPTRKRAPRDEALESELDRSIEEAQNLLKKKK